MKKMRNFIVLTVLAVVGLSACNGRGSGFFGTPSSSGVPYEVMVVADSNLWKSSAGRALFDVLDTDVPGLPQSERSFKISQVDPAFFRQTLRLFRNIIKIDINKDRYTQTKFRYTRDEYASPQVILTIQSPNEADFADFVSKNKQVLIDFFVKIEMNREIQDLKTKHSPAVARTAKEMFDCDFYAPKELMKIKKGKDFFWTSNEANNVNICMYSYPYIGPEAFTKDYFLHMRDSFMRANIPGAEKGMYMTTNATYTDVRDMVVKRQYAQEARGLWEMKDDAMGGPFVSHSRVDTVHNRVVVVEGFVYAPDKLKRDFIRRMEGALYTLNLPAEKTEDLVVDIPEVVISAKRKQE